MKFRNFTSRTITLNNGTKLQSEGVAHVKSNYSPFDENGVCSVEFGEIVGLPEPEEDTYIIVPSVVAAAAVKAGRTDIVIPAISHPETVRELGRVRSVPGFVKVQ